MEYWPLLSLVGLFVDNFINSVNYVKTCSETPPRISSFQCVPWETCVSGGESVLGHVTEQGARNMTGVSLYCHAAGYITTDFYLDHQYCQNLDRRKVTCVDISEMSYILCDMDYGQEINKSDLEEHCSDCLCVGEMTDRGQQDVSATKAWRFTSVVEGRGQPKTLS